MNRPVQHIAIIMDGNGRWAQKRLMPRAIGHVRGASNVVNVVKACIQNEIKYLTLFAFSTENWRRPPEEVSMLMDLFSQYLDKEITQMHKEGIRLRVIGDKKAFAPALQQRIQKVELKTCKNDRLHLIVAANYGGQWDVMQAVQAWQEQNPSRSVNAMTPKNLSEHLSTAGMPDPELLIRTGGESRISNFLLWQTAYTELYFTPIFWPDFDAAELQKSIDWYGERVRRFGQTDEQVRLQPILPPVPESTTTS